MASQLDDPAFSTSVPFAENYASASRHTIVSAAESEMAEAPTTVVVGRPVTVAAVGVPVVEIVRSDPPRGLQRHQVRQMWMENGWKRQHYQRFVGESWTSGNNACPLMEYILNQFLTHVGHDENDNSADRFEAWGVARAIGKYIAPRQRRWTAARRANMHVECDIHARGARRVRL